MSRQYFRELLEPFMVADQTAVTGVTVETILCPITFSNIGANVVRPGQAWSLTAGGLMTAPVTTPGTLTVTPRFGQTVAAGVTLGASTAVQLNTQTAVPWQLQFTFAVRSIGATGTVIGTGSMTSVAVGAAATTPGVINFGGTTATVDTTATTPGLVFGVTPSVTGISITTKYVTFEALN